MDSQYTKEYIDLRRIWPDQEDLAGLLRLAEEALFNNCASSQKELKRSRDENFRFISIHHADNQILAHLDSPFGTIPVYLGESRYKTNNNYTSIDIH